ncbi:flavin-containing monooxygenase [Nocardioides massiliensis]|uniref:Cation diffusion facilitator CzcD-associated flavoprotein CzcO n=1 Tax=Nocardioides massiliensis TaxID=1325935 RepID=A0ABT9NMM4_9ACTN|nr:NAD(P)/FAD-dependent oxidoreductase [Nocardioides massiliensis]MDP9821677.1 cation diffusion facilitator CzcD-associated flavoprotein CzcO [Nocardioides massiliensis]
MRVGIIGTGFGGIGIAAELLRHGYADLRLWERADDLGGVWRDNHYPGAGCDVPSPLYSYSWAPTTRWHRRYALQDQIHDYLRDVADRFGVSPLIRYGRSVVSATWDDEGATWTVGFADGSTEEVEVLISAVGQLSEPHIPAVPGVDDFAGTSFHSARWDHDADLDGKRVAVVGIGASAIQFVPHLVERAAEVTLFQRSANYILPKPDGPLPDWYAPGVAVERRLFRSLGEGFSRGMHDGSKVGEVQRRVALAHLRRQVPDPELRAKLTPDTPIGCKRILFSNNFYPAVSQPHVELVTDAVQEVTAGGVRAGGVEHEADVLIWGTGFATQAFDHGIEVTGRDGHTLAKQWGDGARAHLGVHVPGFPSLFLLYGPNTNLGGSSIVVMLEAQSRHIRSVLDHARRAGKHQVEVTTAAELQWDTEIQQRLATTSWAHCDNWYRHPVSGRITSNWPGSTREYDARLDALDPTEFAWT